MRNTQRLLYASGLPEGGLAAMVRLLGAWVWLTTLVRVRMRASPCGITKCWWLAFPA